MQELMDWLEYLEDGRQQCLKKHFENKAKGASHAIVVGKRPNFVDDLAQLEYNKGRILVAALPSADFLPQNENLMRQAALESYVTLLIVAHHYVVNSGLTSSNCPRGGYRRAGVRSMYGG